MRKIFFSVILCIVGVISAYADFYFGNHRYVETSSTEAKLVQYTNSSSVTSFTVPQTVTNNGKSYTVVGILNNAFENCSLKTVTLPSTVKQINDYAFNGCTALSYINLNKVTYIGTNAFYDCYKLTSADLSSLTQVAAGAFAACHSLSTVSLGNSLTALPDNVFENSGLSAIDLNKVSTLGSNVFKSCANLKTIRVGSVESIPAGTFSGCSAIKDIYCGNTFPYAKGCFETSIYSSATLHFTQCLDDVKEDSEWKWGSMDWSQFSNIDALYPFDIESENTVKGAVSILKAPTCDDPSARIKAYPYAGYAFEAWVDANNGNLVYSYQDEVSISSVTSDMHLVAHFVESNCETNGTFPYQFNITSEDENKGAVSVLKSPDCDDTSARIAAYPYAGYAFEAWYDVDNNLVYSYQQSLTINDVNRNMNLKAYFEVSDCSTNGVFPYQFNVESADLAQGAIMIHKHPDCDDPSARVTAYPYAGYAFEAWTDANNGNLVYSYGPTINVNEVSSNMHLVANWIAASCETNGTFPYMFSIWSDDESMGSVEITAPSCEKPSARVYAHAKAGYEFVIWSDGTTENPRVWVEVNHNVILSALFTERTHSCETDGILGYVLKVEPNSVDMGMTAMTRVPDCQDPNTTIMAMPKTGYEFVRWSDGNTEQSRMISVTTDIYLQAIFQDPNHPLPEGIENIIALPHSASATKLFHEGQFYILRGDKIYTLQGAEVK